VIPERAWVRVAGRRVWYREAGSGPPVLLVAGLGLSSRFYAPSYAAFAAAGLRLVVPDLPGFGRTGGGHLGLSVAGTATLLDGFHQALGLPAAAWVGHSLGWQPAAALAAERPDAVSALVLAAPTLPRGRRRRLRQLATFARAASREARHVILAVARDYLRTSPLAYAGTWYRYAGDDAADRLRRIRCPALILLGTRDPMLSPDDLALLQARLTDSSVIRIPGSTHGLPVEDPAAFNDAVIRFVRASQP
jgi:2-hydroxy-6-oxonona-2,4-dienedioate hydrolase